MSYYILFNQTIPKQNHVYGLNEQEIAQQITSQSGHWLEFEYFEVFTVDELVVLKFSAHSSIDLLSGTVSFQRNWKWARKALCVAITDSPVFKKRFNSKIIECTGLSHDHSWSCVKKMIRYLLDGATITTCLSSLAPHRRWLKMCNDVFFK